MRTRVKICCIASEDEANQAICAGADALGLVGDMPSGPGIIDVVTAASIAAIVPPPVSTFLLTCETSAEAIASHVAAVGPTAVQIVNHIDPGELARLADLIPHVWRVQVIHVEGHHALNLLTAYAPNVHAFLLNSGCPDAELPELGGTGRIHDWAVSARFVAASPRPVFLAGGLNAENARAAISKVRPFGLDLCSGVRTDGRLDTDKLARFMRSVFEEDQALRAAITNERPPCD